jgi:uncharacterized membrane protein YedE/YeeE
MYEYWPWWLSGLALAGLTIGFRLLTGRSLGVSGSWQKVVFWKEEKTRAQQAAQLAENSAGVSSALLAATLAEFGESQLDTNLEEESPKPSAIGQTPARIPWTAHLTFLLCMILGGFLWAYITGSFQLQFELSPLHTQLSGEGWHIGAVLFIGGFLVGVGTQMAGGCSSGHGLNGCALFMPASLIATAVFFGTAVLVSISIQYLFL